MGRTFTCIITVLALGILAGCNGDDDGATPDQKVTADRGGDLPAADSGKDAGVDAAVDAAKADNGVDMAQKDEAGADKAVKEASPGDLAKPDKKKTPPDAASLAVIWGYISRSALPLNDGKGDIHVSVAQVIAFPFPPIQMASGIVKHADLSKPGAKVKYEIASSMTTLSGKYQVTAWMDDNNNVWSPINIATTGDLFTSKAVDITVSSSATKPVKADLVLDKVTLTAGDAGIGTALKGKITTTTSPSSDGKGNMIMALYTKVPPAGIASSPEVLVNVDLSSTYGSEAYFLTGVKPGNYYLRVFMDDNTNASMMVPKPDKGDMIHSKPIQVHVVAGQTNVADVVLDALQK